MNCSKWGVFLAIYASTLTLSGCAHAPDSSPSASAHEEKSALAKVAPLEGGIPADPLFAYKKIGPPSPHWVMLYILDVLGASRQVIVDADSGETKAHISTGMFVSMQASPDGKTLYVSDTLSEGPRLLRKDYLNYYDTSDYSLSRSFEMTGNRRALMAPRDRMSLVGDGRFLVIFDFTPRLGVRVIDTHTGQVMSEIETPGCSLVYPAGERGVSMLCGDGRLLTLHLDAEGNLAKRLVSEPFFNPDVDPIMPNGSDINGVWYFPSYDGMVYPVDLSGETPTFREPWSLGAEVETDEAETERWMPGGPLLLMGSNPARNELYVLMHPVSMSQGVGDFGFPGTEVWVFDVERQVRVRRQVLRSMATNIFVTADKEPLLLASVIDPERYIASEDGVQKVLVTVEVYDAVTGEYLRRFADPGAALVRMRAAPGSNGGVAP